MSTTTKTIHAAIAGLLAIGVAGMSTVAAAADDSKEKCFGVAKKGENSCGNSAHSCAGQAKTDNDPAEWKTVAKGSCEKLGGKLASAKDTKK